MTDFFIIEEDISISSALKAKLSLADQSVITHNGSGDLHTLTERIIDISPDFIILDIIRTSGLDGFDILSAIKGHDELLTIPVFVFTDLSNKETEQQCRNLGADYFFDKNEYYLEEFIKKIMNIIFNIKNK